MTNLNNFSDYSMDIKLYKHLTSSNPNSINLYKKLFKNNIYTNPSVQKEFRYDGLNLPNTMDLEKRGDIIKQDSNHSIFIKKNNRQKKLISIYLNIQNIIQCRFFTIKP